MNNSFTSLIVTKIQLLKIELIDAKKKIAQIEKDLKNLKDRQSTLEKDLKYQQNCNESFKNIRNFNLKLI